MSTHNHLDHAELGDKGLAGIVDLLSEGVCSLEGYLADGFSVRLREIGFSRGPTVIEGLGKPSLLSGEVFCFFRCNAQEVAAAIKRVTTPSDWSYEQGLLRDPTARNRSGDVLWRLDSNTGVIVFEGSGERYA